VLAALNLGALVTLAVAAVPEAAVWTQQRHNNATITPQQRHNNAEGTLNQHHVSIGVVALW